MPKVTLTTYGQGGYDPDLPNDNVVAVSEFDQEAIPSTPDEKLAGIRSALDGLPHNATVVDLVSALRVALGEQ